MWTAGSTGALVDRAGRLAAQLANAPARPRLREAAPLPLPDRPALSPLCMDAPSPSSPISAAAAMLPVASCPAEPPLQPEAAEDMPMREGPSSPAACAHSMIPFFSRPTHPCQNIQLSLGCIGGCCTSRLPQRKAIILGAGQRRGSHALQRISQPRHGQHKSWVVLLRVLRIHADSFAHKGSRFLGTADQTMSMEGQDCSMASSDFHQVSNRSVYAATPTCFLAFGAATTDASVTPATFSWSSSVASLRMACNRDLGAARPRPGGEPDPLRAWHAPTKDPALQSAI